MVARWEIVEVPKLELGNQKELELGNQKARGPMRSTVTKPWKAVALTPAFRG